MCSDGVSDFRAVIAFKDVPKCSPPIWIVRSGPAFGCVPVVAKCVEVAFGSRGCWVEGGPVIQFDARHNEVQLHISLVNVLDPKTMVLVCFQPRERRKLKVVHDSCHLVLAWLVFSSEGNHPAHVPPFSMIAVY